MPSPAGEWRKGKIMKGLIALLVMFTTLQPVVAEEELPRVVNVAVLVDGGDDVMVLRNILQDAIYFATQKFRREFNIELRLTEFNIGSWRSPSDNFDGSLELVRLSEIKFRNSDIAIAFTTKKFFRNEEILIDGESAYIQKKLGGIAMLSGNRAIVRLEEKAGLIFIHELAHLFGAGHSSDTLSVMVGEGIAYPTFDRKSREVILANRNRQF